MARAKQFAATVQQQIMQQLGISAEAYFDALFDAGIAYAEANSFCAVIAQAKTHSQMYWAWYENQFAITDEVFLANYQYNGADARLRQYLRAEWQKAHAPENIKAFPPAIIYTKTHEYEQSN